MKKLLLILIPLIILLILSVIIYKIFLSPAVFQVPMTKSPDNFVLAELLSEQGFSQSLSPLVAGDTLFATVSGITVLFSRSTDLKEQVRSLQLLLPKVTMNGRTPQSIDLRYTKAVIKY